MSIDNLSPENIETKKRKMLEKIPDSGYITNRALLDKLIADQPEENWSEDIFWYIRNRLVEEGLLRKGKGQGGSSMKVLSQTSDQQQPEQIGPTSEEGFEEIDAQVIQNQAKEQDLYTPIAEALRRQWSKEQGFDDHIVLETAKQGKKYTGGKWTRPDITVFGCKTFPYTPGRFLEVITFEIKTSQTADIVAVYEALAHRRAATRAFVIICKSNYKTIDSTGDSAANCDESITKDKEDFDAVLDIICDESKKYGIGVIVAETPNNFFSWEVHLEADSIVPDPRRLNEFITQQTTVDIKEQIIKWVK